MSRNTDIVNENLPKGKSIPLSEVGSGDPIEQVSENDFVKSVELESFMNEILTIIVHPTAEDGALDVVVPMVNGMNQPIVRGAESKVRRKYVEALARCRTTKYVQQVMDPARPENIQMTDRTAVSYPFSIIHDPNPIGRQWIESIMSER